MNTDTSTLLLVATWYVPRLTSIARDDRLAHVTTWTLWTHRGCLPACKPPSTRNKGMHVLPTGRDAVGVRRRRLGVAAIAALVSSLQRQQPQSFHALRFVAHSAAANPRTIRRGSAVDAAALHDTAESTANGRPGSIRWRTRNHADAHCRHQLLSPKVVLWRPQRRSSSLAAPMNP